MATLEILYVILGTCVVVITATIVWFANEAIGLIRSARRSSEDVETVTREIKEKVLLVSEALDRAGMAATSIISLIEDAVEGIKKKREYIASGLSLITGAGDFSKKDKAIEEKELKVEEEKPEKGEKAKEEKPVKKEEKNDLKADKDEKEAEKSDKPESDDQEKSQEKK
ncbi:MAG: hypothetical protein NTZ65_05105 [Candidatus Berkelbacteria bacterium]|nr:hypothetical protein [Candidatus Berkelbacteria bacterium]